MLMSKVKWCVLKANDGTLSREDCSKAIDYLVEIRCATGGQVSYEEKKLTEYFIERFIMDKLQ